MKVVGPVMVMNDPSYREFSDGKGREYTALCKWRLPRGERLPDKNGQWSTQYYSVMNLRFTFWQNREGQYPKIIQELKKGNVIFIDGHLITGRKKDGGFFVDVKVDSIIPLPKGSKSTSTMTLEDDETTTEVTKPTRRRTTTKKEPAPVLDDDMPF